MLVFADSSVWQFNLGSAQFCSLATSICRPHSGSRLAVTAGKPGPIFRDHYLPRISSCRGPGQAYSQGDLVQKEHDSSCKASGGWGSETRHVTLLLSAGQSKGQWQHRVIRRAAKTLATSIQHKFSIFIALRKMCNRLCALTYWPTWDETSL